MVTCIGTQPVYVTRLAGIDLTLIQSSEAPNINFTLG